MIENSSLEYELIEGPSNNSCGVADIEISLFRSRGSAAIKLERRHTGPAKGAYACSLFPLKTNTTNKQLVLKIDMQGRNTFSFRFIRSDRNLGREKECEREENEDETLRPKGLVAERENGSPLGYAAKYTLLTLDDMHG